MMYEMWEPIEEFPNYSVSNLGNIINITTERIVLPSLTKQGALKVALVNSEGRKTRSVKVLVANAFVDGKNEIFNTPIHLDMNQLNVRSDNLVWRPRWFSWVYTYQDREPVEDRENRYGKGPIIDLDSGEIYNDVYHVSRVNGLIWWHVYVAVHGNDRRGVFPTGQRFAYLYGS